jgi:hypothetical protein
MADAFDRAFAALEPRERNSLRAIAIARSYDRGEILFHQGDDPGALHAIIRGRVKISAITDDAREALFSLAGPGDLVGEISALARRQRTATVRALEPVSAHSRFRLMHCGRRSAARRAWRSSFSRSPPTGCRRPISSAWSSPATMCLGASLGA